MSVNRYFAIVPAAGVGSRLGSTLPKQYLPIGDRCVLQWAVAPLARAGWIERVFVVVAHDDTRAAGLFADQPRVSVVAVGGLTRRDTVLNMLGRLTEAGADDWVLVHDAARPGLDDDALVRLRDALDDDAPDGSAGRHSSDRDSCGRAASSSDSSSSDSSSSDSSSPHPSGNDATGGHTAGSGTAGGLLAWPVSDTVKRADARAGVPAQVAATLPRDGLWLAQTPQMFRKGVLQAALARHPLVTDEAGAMEAEGCPVRLVPGGAMNFKVTTAQDLALMRRLLVADATADHPQQARD